MRPSASAQSVAGGSRYSWLDIPCRFAITSGRRSLKQRLQSPRLCNGRSSIATSRFSCTYRFVAAPTIFYVLNHSNTAPQLLSITSIIHMDDITRFTAPLYRLFNECSDQKGIKCYSVNMHIKFFHHWTIFFLICLSWHSNHLNHFIIRFF